MNGVKTVRKNIRMSEKLASFYENKALEMGISQSASMVMALDNYMRQEKSIAGVELLRELNDKFLESEKQAPDPAKG